MDLDGDAKLVSAPKWIPLSIRCHNCFFLFLFFFSLFWFIFSSLFLFFSFLFLNLDYFGVFSSWNFLIGFDLCLIVATRWTLTFEQAPKICKGYFGNVEIRQSSVEIKMQVWEHLKINWVLCNLHVSVLVLINNHSIILPEVIRVSFHGFWKKKRPMRPTWRVWIFVPLNSTMEHEELFHDSRFIFLLSYGVLRYNALSIYDFLLRYTSYIYFLIHDNLLSPGR